MTSELHHILNLARWAPSGDNTQPWRFEILSEQHLLVHGLDTRAHCVYDLDGHASQLAIGALLENIRIAASGQKMRVNITRRLDTSPTHLLFDVWLKSDVTVMQDPLLGHIESRVVQRRALSMRRLDTLQRQVLEDSLPTGYRLILYQDFAERWRLARFMFDNAKIRLTIPEAYAVHKAVIEWGAQYSEDRIPGQAVGVDPVTARFMRWVMTSWARVDFFNTYLLGHLFPRLQLDLLPGLRCGAHFALCAPKPPESIDDYIAAGQVMQRFWLSVASMGWFVQPEMTPVIFARYHRNKMIFSENDRAVDRVGALNQRLDRLLPTGLLASVFFMGRMGGGSAPRSRSTRKKLEDLLLAGD